MNLEKYVSDLLRRLGLPPDACCLIALSGGGDSVALLDLVSSIADSYPISIHAARVVHGIRGSVVEEKENTLCRGLCLERNIQFNELVPEGETVTDIEERYSCGPEQAARELRRGLFRSHMIEIGAEYLLVGHTADDRLETIFMRLLSGSGPEGLMGIFPGNGAVLRPLIGITRSELRIHLISRNIQWAEDSTNAENVYKRNRMRNELIPLISEIFPGWGTALNVLGERSLEASESLKRAASEQLHEIIGECRYSWNENEWDSASEYSKALALWKAFNFLDNSGIPDRRFPWRSLKEARSAVNKRRAWNSFGFSLERRNGRVSMSRGEMSGKYGISEGRVLLDRHDVAGIFTSVLGGFRISAVLERRSGWQFLALSAGEWPLEIRFGGSLGIPEIKPSHITEKSSVDGRTDADKELVYILIEPAEEGSDA